jgi:TRAP-type C4-dicarboxylate transport system permease small subunit
MPAWLVRLATMAALAARLVAAAMFAGVFLVFCAKIIMRYAAHDEMPWADEVSSILFIWIIFWANAFILRDADHIRFDLVYHAVPPAARRAMALARAVLLGGLFAYAAPTTISYLIFLWREQTPVLGLPLDEVYAIFGVFVLTVPLRAAWAIGGLLRADWRRRI